MTRRDFITSDDVSTDELVALLDAADRYKAERRPLPTLAGRTVAMIFEKPSTRTRVSFEVAVHELGGYPLPLAGADLQIGRGETIDDTAVVLSRYVHAIVLRTFTQENLERMARASSVPVVNALSDYAHPCQALADLQTIRERRKQLEGLRLAYLGDGNNVCHSLLIAGTKVGMHLAVATPAGYEPIPQVVRRAGEIAAETGGSVELTHDPKEAAKDADVLYTDVWASMGQELEHGERPVQVGQAGLDGRRRARRRRRQHAHHRRRGGRGRPPGGPGAGADRAGPAGGAAAGRPLRRGAAGGDRDPARRRPVDPGRNRHRRAARPAPGIASGPHEPVRRRSGAAHRRRAGAVGHRRRAARLELVAPPLPRRRDQRPPGSRSGPTRARGVGGIAGGRGRAGAAGVRRAARGARTSRGARAAPRSGRVGLSVWPG